MDERLLESLGVLGLSLYEARAYCTLLTDHPLNAYELAKRCRIPSSKIYETLQRLQTKGCVLVYRSEPILYGPVPVADMVGRVRLRMTRALDDVELALKHAPKPMEAGLTWSVDGRTNLLDAIEAAIRRARSRIFAALWDEELERLAPSLREASQRTVELEVAIYGHYALDAGHTYDLTLCGRSAKERLNGRRLSAVVVDDAEAIVTEFGAAGVEQGIWTRNPVVALLTTEYIREEIMGRVLINELGETKYQDLRSSRPELVAMLKREARPTPTNSTDRDPAPPVRQRRARRSRSANPGA